MIEREAAAWAAPVCWKREAPAPFELWRIDLAQPVSELGTACLDADERVRAEGFQLNHLRRRYLAGHVARRYLLAQACGTESSELRFERGECGKPSLAGLGTRWPAFNFSDSEDVALLAITARGEIGIDVERLKPVPDAIELATAHFCSREARWLAAYEPQSRDRAFLRVWTRKEACLKALGSGLSIPAACFDGGLHGDFDVPTGLSAWCRTTIPTPRGFAEVEVIEIDPGSDSVAALARRVMEVEA